MTGRALNRSSLNIFDVNSQILGCTRHTSGSSIPNVGKMSCVSRPNAATRISLALPDGFRDAFDSPSRFRKNQSALSTCRKYLIFSFETYYYTYSTITTTFWVEDYLVWRKTCHSPLTWRVRNSDRRSGSLKHLSPEHYSLHDLSCLKRPRHSAIHHGRVCLPKFNTLHSVNTSSRNSIALPTQSMRLLRPLVLSRVSTALR